VITVAAAVLVFVAGWTGQIRTIFFTVSAVLVFSVTLDLVLPSVARRFAASDAGAHQQPYAATRVAFTRRAYDDTSTPPREVARFASFGDSSRSVTLVEEERPRLLVYPGARGAAIVTNAGAIPAPMLGSGLGRLAHAWAEQRLDLLWGPFPAEARIARRRDVRDRVQALAPIFAQGSNVSPTFLGDTLMWVVELYSASSWYPLSAHYNIAGSDRSYFRHSGTTLVNSQTGRVMIIPDPTPDPIAVAWRAKFPGVFRPGRPDILDALTNNPTGVSASGAAATRFPTGTDSAFRTEVTRLYGKMRQALTSGDLKSFGAAYDSLGALIRRE
jgi:hypothetical protein